MSRKTEMGQRAVRLPKHVRDLFWEYDAKKIHWRTDSDLIIQKILESGKWESLEWLIPVAGSSRLRNYLIRRRGAGLGPPQLRFWQIILDLPTEEVNIWIATAKSDPWGRRMHR